MSKGSKGKRRLLNPDQWDMRPDPKKPGQQGVLFRREAPARGTPDQRRGIVPGRWGDVEDTRHTQGGRVHGIPSELYHGTAARLKPGSLITPGRPQNYDPYVNTGYGKTQDINREHVFAASELHYAHSAARVAQERRKMRNPSSYGRAYVYRVQPTGPVQSDAEGDRGAEDYVENFQSKRPFRVLSRIQFGEHQEAYRAYMEDELGEKPGTYQWSPPTTEMQRELGYRW